MKFNTDNIGRVMHRCDWPDFPRFSLHEIAHVRSTESVPVLGADDDFRLGDFFLVLGLRIERRLSLQFL